jgi:hypothetical protein
MPDISMCQHSACPKSKECYRFMAIPDKWQSYMAFEFICKESNNYQWLYEIGDKKVREIEVEKLKEGEDSTCVKMNNIET